MIAFTLCSNNYLAQAKVLGDSFLKYHPGTRFIIGLVDEFSPEIDYNVFDGFSIIPVRQIAIENVDELISKYNVTEFNTAVKPFYFRHLFQTFKTEKIIYLDPDICVYSKFEEVELLLSDYNIVITPQSRAPIDDGDSPSDIHLLGTGVFNLGFIALSNYTSVESFLDWWSARTRKYAYGRASQHMFFDQLMMNLVPVFFNNYHILKHPGYNMAAWNMHERKITDIKPNRINVDENDALRFFHFSGYKFDRPEVFCAYNSRFTPLTRPLEATVFSAYFDAVMAAGLAFYSKILPRLNFATQQQVKEGFITRLKKGIRYILQF